ncbi:MAG: hypothetical protein M3544_08675 [Pseudomonadota bacterium]|nr:hypothetical protein [Pseudomonadota bacterium]
MPVQGPASLGTPKDNRLLAALPKDSYDALLPLLEPLAMPLGLSVYESGGAQGYVYFPTTGGGSKRECASATRWSRGSTTGCCRK